MESENKRKRSSNFTSNDKCILINIVAKYKHVIENKKTDSVTAKEKCDYWEKISVEFNSSGPSCPRDTECLKRCYENRKKLLRKLVASQRRELYKTGGGLPKSDEKKEPGDELLLSIVSDKTMKGLEHSFGGDAMDIPPVREPQPECNFYEADDNIEISWETDCDDHTFEVGTKVSSPNI